MHGCWLALSVIIAGGVVNGQQCWTYTDPDTGPYHWRNLNESSCGGRFQSPINIVTGLVEYSDLLKPVRIIYGGRGDMKKLEYTLQNTGYTAQINFPPQTWYVSLFNSSKHDYEVVQLHFHWGKHDWQGAEHQVNWRLYSAEAHLVSYNKMYANFSQASVSPHGYAVLGFWLQSHHRVPVERTHFGKLGTLVSALKKIVDPFATTKMPGFNLAELLDQVNPGAYFRYYGSLTTPPCTENVLWTIFEQPVPVRNDQLEALRALQYNPVELEDTICNNFRPISSVGSQASPMPRRVFCPTCLRFNHWPHHMVH